MLLALILANVQRFRLVYIRNLKMGENETVERIWEDLNDATFTVQGGQVSSKLTRRAI